VDRMRVTEVLASSAARAAIAAGDVGAVIRLVRTALGIRQADLGAAIGFSQPAISKLERGGCSDVGVLSAVATHLGIPPFAVGLSGAAIRTAEPTHTLGVLPRDVGQPGDGWSAAGGGVGSVVIVVMQPGG
jgi:hypothetical protein